MKAVRARSRITVLILVFSATFSSAKCPLGKYRVQYISNNSPVEDCAECEVGKYGHHAKFDPWGSPACFACPKGRYQHLLGQTSCAKGSKASGVSVVSETPIVSAGVNQVYSTHGKDEQEFNDQVGKAQQELFRKRDNMKCPTGGQKAMVGFGFKCVGCPVSYYGIQLSGDDKHPMCVECPAGKFTLQPGRKTCLTDVTRTPTQEPTRTPTAFPTEQGETIIAANIKNWKAQAKAAGEAAAEKNILAAAGLGEIADAAGRGAGKSKRRCGCVRG
jgi:hypothetical protein